MIGDKVLYYMNKGDIQSCTNYHGTKLMTHIMETLEECSRSILKGVISCVVDLLR